MTLTNKLNLPEPIFKAVVNDDYNRGKSDFTVTELNLPPRLRLLKKKHDAEITEDVSSRLWSLFGQVGHLILERAGMEGYVERRFYQKMLGYVIGGKADLILKPTEHQGIAGSAPYPKAKLIDYKFCSHYTTKEGIKPDWTAQINMLRFLASDDYDIDEAEIVAIYWPESVKQGQVKDPASVLPVELWSEEQTFQYICDRITLHLNAEKELPLCTDAERWATPEQFAVMKLGGKRALKLHDSMGAAQSHMNSLGIGGYLIEHRPPVYKRCERYCAAAPFCSQFKNGQ